MTNDAYAALTERLDFPGSERLRLILTALMTPEQARIAEALPGTPAEVAGKTGAPAGRVKEQLDDLFFKGVAFVRGDFGKREYFRFARNIVQLHDAAQASRMLDVTKDRKFYELWHDFCLNEMYPALARHFQSLERPQFRIVPAKKAIQGLDGVLPGEDFHELLRAQELIAVVPCSCRYRTTAVGEPCAQTREPEQWHCLQFGRGADYAIKRGSGRQLSLKEALELCDKIEGDGLLHIWDNNTSMTGINTSCQCCCDCCENFVAMARANLNPGTLCEKSRYLAYVDVDECIGCQDCLSRCQFDAIEIECPEESKEYKAAVDPEKCFGCGACVATCASGALKMKAIRPPEHIPPPAV
ncbi:ATP-binding protein [Chloroflexota bacterium]